MAAEIPKNHKSLTLGFDVDNKSGDREAQKAHNQALSLSFDYDAVPNNESRETHKQDAVASGSGTRSRKRSRGTRHALARISDPSRGGRFLPPPQVKASLMFPVTDVPPPPNFRVGGSSGSTPLSTVPTFNFMPSPLLLPYAPVQPDVGVGGKKLRFLLQKQLKLSDVCSLGRIVLPKRAAVAFLPTIMIKEGIIMKMNDVDSHQAWTFRYRFWPNNKSRMYVLENTGVFAAAHKLQIGDYAMIYKDDQNGKYFIRGRKISDPVGKCDYRRNSVFDANRPSFINLNMPYTNEETMDPSIFYDTTYTADVPANPATLNPLPNIGSVDNLTLNDFP